MLERLRERNPEALLLEPREVYDPARVDLTDTPEDGWNRPPGTWVAVYDADRCVEAIMEWLGCDDTGAMEFFSFNTSGCWAGEHTPTFRMTED